MSTRLLMLFALLAATGCELDYPEVVVVNQTADYIELRNPSFSGCVWNTVLGFGQTTTVARCLPGSDRVHFQKLDVAAYCAQHADDPQVAAACAGDTSAGTTIAGTGQGDPVWFNYETVSVKRVDYGQFHLFAVTLDDMEQDFSIPGPYGH
ncbi:MAG TPA: hypothetical protein VMT43_11715 [Acidimicrobiales bacterium]|nr:hypothetical protein [Acidimicrobiales bacterium]